MSGSTSSHGFLYECDWLHRTLRIYASESLFMLVCLTLAIFNNLSMDNCLTALIVCPALAKLDDGHTGRNSLAQEAHTDWTLTPISRARWKIVRISDDNFIFYYGARGSGKLALKTAHCTCPCSLTDWRLPSLMTGATSPLYWLRPSEQWPYLKLLYAVPVWKILTGIFLRIQRCMWCRTIR